MSGSSIHIAVTGISGRLGRAIATEVIRANDLSLVGGMVSSDSPNLGADLGEMCAAGFMGIEAVVSLEQAADQADVLIDASLPKVTSAIAPRLASMGHRALVTGVTGLDDEQQAALHQAAEVIPVLQASNFSLGVALVERLLAQAAKALTAEHFDIEIIEAHHKRKADAPSGTALSLGETAANARGVALEDVAQFNRPRHDGHRPMGAIGFSAIRGGGVVGEHEARFLSAFEEVSISHKAYDRFIFAQGALEAARWIKGKAPGLYSMQDVLGD
ncbi:MAG: 4-hydroxy-tetrahydrodipicolinate reductase [Oceanicaulis sp.]|jgi:4-hydroxy-tetrahydrodipicolinate reductase|nr:4-hydroxy-tetrahydrodipicolinate reductase [Oceanicaulis sp.]